MSDNGVTDPSERTKYKAQVYDLALNAFFKLREFDSDSLQLSRAEVGWDIAEAFVAAAVSGVTYKSASPDRRFEAASLLRALADQVEEDGLADLEWGYQGRLDARHAWRGWQGRSLVRAGHPHLAIGRRPEARRARRRHLARREAAHRHQDALPRSS